MAERHEIVFLVDVDNTLLDNDRVVDDLRGHLASTFGSKAEAEYWAIFEELRSELGYADYLGALQRYRVEHAHHPHLLNISLFLLNYPFADRLYPGALDVIGQMRRVGPVVILSDGDVVFQPWKVSRSGLWDAVDGHVLIYVHKEQRLDDVERRYPARRYVLVDDKVRILAAIKNVWADRVFTVCPRQGHYALDPKLTAAHPPANLSISAIADLADYDFGTDDSSAGDSQS